ncbi:Uncharacterised protein [Actinomyces bovis]|uniref:Uncharacterized protein n=1 Tax=Actinomyces bovis TaxID=1658 RepID=A0ABY1VQ58_9ACTO|nr:Uncharacterised protein [Actinomyces bovis]VEG52404.1 Uncharacterised protein [Actinomyces israelii]
MLQGTLLSVAALRSNQCQWNHCHGVRAPVSELLCVFTEFLVAQAVGATGPRVEWDPYEVITPDGTTIE